MYQFPLEDCGANNQLWIRNGTPDPKHNLQSDNTQLNWTHVCGDILFSQWYIWSKRMISVGIRIFPQGFPIGIFNCEWVCMQVHTIAWIWFFLANLLPQCVIYPEKRRNSYVYSLTYSPHKIMTSVKTKHLDEEADFCLRQGVPYLFSHWVPRTIILNLKNMWVETQTQHNKQATYHHMLVLSHWVWESVCCPYSHHPCILVTLQQVGTPMPSIYVICICIHRLCYLNIGEYWRFLVVVFMSRISMEIFLVFVKHVHLFVRYILQHDHCICVPNTIS